MAWTYSGNPATSLRDQVRFLIGDTDPDDPLLQDEEIDWLLAQSNQNVLAAAAEACQAISARYSRQADRQVGDLRIALSQKAEAYAKRAQEFRAKLPIATGTPFAGGINKQPYFRLGLHNYEPQG